MIIFESQIHEVRGTFFENKYATQTTQEHTLIAGFQMQLRKLGLNSRLQGGAMQGQ